MASTSFTLSKSNNGDESKQDEEVMQQEDSKKNEKGDESLLADMVTAEEYLESSKVILLDYERQMFHDIIHADGLVICSKGISYDEVLVNFLKVYSDAGNLILIINASEAEEQYYKSQLDPKYVHEIANTANERERVYLEGGIQFISARILVVDLLKQRIPVELITGIVVLKAHAIIESCQEAFALRLYRKKNKTGFIKGFSGNPEAFAIGYSHVERIMRNLFVKELFLWPRFRNTIRDSLKLYEPRIIEFHVPMSPKMSQIQTCILDIMNFSVKEIKYINRLVDLDEITVENCISKNFGKILQAQLDCIWHQLSSQTKAIVTDLKILRSIMLSVIFSDSVSTYSLTRRYRTREYAANNSGWVFTDAADQMFKLVKERVYNENNEFSPEQCPKWKPLLEILRTEIPHDIRISSENSNSSSTKVLILCSFRSTCFQLNQLLTESGEKYLFNTALKSEISINKLSQHYKDLQKKVGYKKSFSSDGETKETSTKSKKSSKEENEESKNLERDELNEMQFTDDDNDQDSEMRESYILTMSQRNRTIFDGSENVDEKSEDDSSFFEPFPEMENLDITSLVNTSNEPIIVIQTFKTEKEGAMSLNNILNSFQPQYVIMYDCNVTATRQLEVFEARQKRCVNKRMKVFFLIHAKTVEEQTYLTNLRREKQTFEMLIETKSKMVIPEYQDGKTDEAFSLLKSIVNEEENANTRQAGGQKSHQPLVSHKVIVDMREFRSDLPCLLHRRGLEIIPVTIAIGDYILTPEMCVERKSISDLIGSLNSGRLYNQCMQMQRYYSKPTLLIEFDQNKPFHLQNSYILSNSGTSTSNADILEKLQLLTIHFPKLHLIWSPSPHSTAQLFEELKKGKPEPDSAKAVAIASDESNLQEIDDFNSNIYDFMIRLPGITSKNIGKVMRQGGSFKELLKKSEEELSKLLDSEINAKLFWNILHGVHKPEESDLSSNMKYNKYKRGGGLASRSRGRQQNRGKRK